MPVSAGLMLFREINRRLEVLLVHPGGPFWTRKDEGAWTIPKGEIVDGEAPLDAARRELFEETGFSAEGEALPLDPIRQAGGKVVHAWAVQADVDPAALKSNTFTIEWPPKSGRMQTFPEVDRAAWLPLEEAHRRINRGQTPFLNQLEELWRRSSTSR